MNTSPRTFSVLPIAMVICLSVALIGCQEGTGSWEIGDYQDPLHPQYMATPTVLHFPDSGAVYLEEAEYASFKEDLFGFMDSNNQSEYERHFRDYYLPETFPTDSVFDLYVRMWGQWDSIGVSTRFDHWKLLYSSPFYEGEVYDVALAEVELRHHMVFQKRWTGNYKNFGRTLGERYPGARIEYLDTTYVEPSGDTIYKRHITAEAERLLYAVRRHGVDGQEEDGIRWLNDGWQLVPSVVAIMDSSAVAKALAHQGEFGTLKAPVSRAGKCPQWKSTYPTSGVASKP
ncbi:MAG: hypothetical protein L7S63_07105 [Flavobacteriales bacterium]|nr:hypothetical protein [Flavobacteriales bacterium]